MSLIPFDKFARLFRIIRQNGGVIPSLLKLWKMDTLKEGTCVGQDAMGNKYYENKSYMLGRSRWVEYNPMFNWDYDASQVTPEWFGWLHYKTDRLPCEDWPKYCLKTCCWSQTWLLPPMENVTGTQIAYYPYSTTRPNIQVDPSVSDPFLLNQFTSGTQLIDKIRLSNQALNKITEPLGLLQTLISNTQRRAFYPPGARQEFAASNS